MRGHFGLLAGSDEPESISGKKIRQTTK